MSSQEATSACHSSQCPHSTFLDKRPHSPQTIPVASPPHLDTPRTLRAAPQTLLTCSRLPGFAQAAPFTENAFPRGLLLEKSCSSPKAKALMEGGRELTYFPSCHVPRAM